MALNMFQGLCVSGAGDLMDSTPRLATLVDWYAAPDWVTVDQSAFLLGVSSDAVKSFIDASRIALFGFSWSGHTAVQDARYVEGIHAMIANPAMPNVFCAALAQQ